ncbi:MAG: multicopper oxidase domain-containing protein [Rhodobacterales bacterium]|nr:multicopper oxidase domain-containing protein [Rhodobacterales bacterium]
MNGQNMSTTIHWHGLRVDNDMDSEGTSPGFMVHEVEKLPALPEPTQEVEIVLNTGSGSAFAWSINGDVYGQGDAIPVKGDRPTRLTIVEMSGIPHPFHVPGQFFQILDRDDGELFKSAQLDTVMVNGFETVTIQTDFSNPGVWMAHCHLLEHAELGMMTEIHVGQ